MVMEEDLLQIGDVVYFGPADTTTPYEVDWVKDDLVRFKGWHSAGEYSRYPKRYVVIERRTGPW